MAGRFRKPAVCAILSLRIIASIFVPTVSAGSQGTTVSTGLMLLATLSLLAWESPRWRPSSAPSRLPGLTSRADGRLHSDFRHGTWVAPGRAVDCPP